VMQLLPTPSTLHSSTLYQYINWRHFSALHLPLNSPHPLISESPIASSLSADALSDARVFRRREVDSQVGAWSGAVGNAFLKPYDLNSDASTITASGTAGAVHQEALGQLPPEVSVYTFEAAAPAGAEGGANATGGR
jgi:hypothetical protein